MILRDIDGLALQTKSWVRIHRVTALMANLQMDNNHESFPAWDIDERAATSGFLNR